MKKIIKGKRYDTSTAKEIATDWSDLARTDFGYWEETLYQKRNGEFFLYGWGGAMSKYSEQIGQNEWCGGCDLIPMTEEEAREWGENHMTAETYESTFGAVPEGNTETFYTGGGIWLTARRIDAHRYYIVDDWDCLTLYDDFGENDEDYPCIRMIWSKSEDEMTKDEKVTYHEMKAELYRLSY